MGQSDEELILEYQSGNQKAVEVIFTRYKIPVLNFCLRILGNRADAEDVTGEVFLALLSQKYSADPKAKFSTWLFTVARNSCISRLRKRKNLVAVWFNSKESEKADEWDIPDTKEDFRENLKSNETSEYIRRAIGRLALEQKEALILREYHQLSYEEIAQILNCSLEKVKILIFRARENLKVELSSFLKEDLK